MTATTCERQVCALTEDDEREMRPCVRETGHDGVCRYARSTSTTPTSTPTHFPAWCVATDCNGEHYSGQIGWTPACAGLPRSSGYGGVTFPAITVAVWWDTIDNLQPAISIHIGDPDRDEQADMTIHEARNLLDALADAIAVLEFSGVTA